MWTRRDHWLGLRKAMLVGLIYRAAKVGRKPPLPCQLKLAADGHDLRGQLNAGQKIRLRHKGVQNRKGAEKRLNPF